MTTTQRWTLVAAVLGSGIVFLDGSVVNVALPTIGEELPAHIIGVAGLLAAGAAVNQLGLRSREKPAEATRMSSEAATG